MKQHYSLKIFLATMLLIAGVLAQAQQAEFLNVNNVNAGIGSGGYLFSNADITVPAPMFEVPKGSGIVAIYNAGLWMSGKDAGGNLKCAAQRYTSQGLDFLSGPIANNYTPAFDTFFKQVFKITRAQIAHHQNLGSPLTQSQIDSAILFWPAKGNPFINTATGVNLDSALAPFADVDNNGKYDPRTGDYPDVCGDEAIFFVFNDYRGNNALKLGVEVRGLAQSNYYGNSPVSNTIFVSYEVVSRSVNRVDEFCFSLLEDVDLGCFSNDRVGCDTSQNLMFAYNGTAIDLDCQGIKGYGNVKAAHGIKLLKGGFGSFAYFTNGAAPAQTDPPNAAGIRNYQTGFWNDGTPFGDNGTGYNSGSPTKFLFSGNPNKVTDWTDESSAYPAGDRRMVGTSATSTMLYNDVKKFDYAFFVTLDSTATNLSIVDSLKRDAVVIQDFYNNNFLGCLANPFTPTGIINTEPELKLLVYPNPASSTTIVECEIAIDRIEVTDILGRIKLSKEVNSTKCAVDISGLAEGVYLLKIKASNKSTVQKIVKQ